MNTAIWQSVTTIQVWPLSRCDHYPGVTTIQAWPLCRAYLLIVLKTEDPHIQAHAHDGTGVCVLLTSLVRDYVFIRMYHVQTVKTWKETKNSVTMPLDDPLGSKKPLRTHYGRTDFNNDRLRCEKPAAHVDRPSGLKTCSMHHVIWHTSQTCQPPLCVNNPAAISSRVLRQMFIASHQKYLTS
jgi:hypothetical protein